MDFENFALCLKEICAHSLFLKRNFLICTFIVNPTAGGFTIPSRWKIHQAQLAEAAEKIKDFPERQSFYSSTALKYGGALGEHGLVLTEKPGDAGMFADAVVREAEIAPEHFKLLKDLKPFYLIITAGGDGTSREVLTSIFNAPEEVRRRIGVLRLPMGTGNDGADAWELGAALDLLIERSILTEQRALRLRTASGKGPFLAFNILSVGLDAFVTHMTNKMKGKFAGDSYKLWVDIAALFYDRIYKVGYMDVKSTDAEGKQIKVLREKLLLLAMGASGRRTYGSHKWILPDERNVCAMKQMSLFRKLALKELFNTGTHINKPESILWNASAIEFSARHPLLAQMDGETVLLEKDDFPAVIELTAPVIPVLQRSDLKDTRSPLP